LGEIIASKDAVRNGLLFNKQDNTCQVRRSIAFNGAPLPWPFCFVSAALSSSEVISASSDSEDFVSTTFATGSGAELSAAVALDAVSVGFATVGCADVSSDILDERGALSSRGRSGEKCGRTLKVVERDCGQMLDVNFEDALWFGSVYVRLYVWTM
jgi:hypothetical protein